MNNIYSITNDDRQVRLFRNSKGKVWIEITEGYQVKGIQIELFEAKAIGEILIGLGHPVQIKSSVTIEDY